MRLGVWFGVAALAVAGAAAAQQAAQKKQIQCWTDDQGVRMCGDSVPPQYANKKREVINDRGMVVETKKGAETEAERAEEARKAKEAEDAKKREDYDRSLLETYRSVKDLENMRSERLDLIDARITATRKIKEEDEASLKSLQDRADAAAKDKKPVDDKLAKQIKHYTKVVAEDQASLDRNAKERESTEQKFNRDIARYSELKGLPPPAAPAAPVATTAPKAAPAAVTTTPAPK